MKNKFFQKIIRNSWTKYIIIIAAIIFLATIMENNPWGWVGIILLLLAWPVYRLILNRQSLMIGLRGLESTIWGKPLDKDLWDKGEMKRTKVKFVWRKKKDE